MACTIAPAPQGVGVLGREEELADLAARLGEPGNNCRLVVHGPPGVGKSELLREVGRRLEARYPGGRYWLDCRLGLAEELERLGRTLWPDLPREGSVAERAVLVVAWLAEGPVLLLFDNASSQEEVEPFLPPSGQCHLLVSSTQRDWGPPALEVWRQGGLRPLSPKAARDLLAAVAGEEVSRQVGEPLLAIAAGLPVHLLPTALALRQLARNGHLNRAQLDALSAEATLSFSLPWGQLTPAARLLLQAAARWLNPTALMEQELIPLLEQALGGREVVEAAVMACQELHLLQGQQPLAMHQLLTRFVAAQPPERVDGLGAEDLGEAAAAALREAATAVGANPASAAAIQRLLSHRLSAQEWAEAGPLCTAELCEAVGAALFALGRFGEADSWWVAGLERLRNGSAGEPADSERIGVALHGIGNCRSQRGEWEEAAGWYEQAAEAKRQGDVNGRVNQESLGVTLHQLGNCRYQRGEWEEAAGWYEQAAEAKRQGDVHGRVNQESLGVTLRALAACRAKQRRRWFWRWGRRSR